ncbi:hypothetical protein Syun_004602 [Stephania yunnanensis]|uniref:Uncharacterized protein n=1 Tax=Stephania yunnanensis TaxID=152371 RepID=A0AAP0L4A7_9MAGN
MSPSRYSSRVDTLELKAQIIRRVGHQRAEAYFNHLNKLLSLKLRKSEFHKQCVATIGRENIALHNKLIVAIIKNACLAKVPPPKESKLEDSLNSKFRNGYHRSNLQSLCRDAFPQSPRRCRSSNFRDRKFRDRPSPLGPSPRIHSTVCDESAPRTQEQQSGTDLFSPASRPLGEVVSVEEGEEVDQVAVSPSVQSRSPVKAPLGISISSSRVRKKGLRSSFLSGIHHETCRDSYMLPDAGSLRRRLEQKLEGEGLELSMDCIDLLNSGLDAFLKRLVKPCMELAASRCRNEYLKQVQSQVTPALYGVLSKRLMMQRPNQPISASLLDFQVALQLNPHLLGEAWPTLLEKVCLNQPDE